jgi:dTDP-4-dehydrorhamnose reductase
VKTIAILGANGQVGTEVCIYLSLMSDVRVVPVCRTELASCFLRKCGLRCRLGSVAQPERLVAALDSADLVVDFTLPRGSTSEVRASTRANIRGLQSAAPRRSEFAYISSTMACGLGPKNKRYRYYAVARTPYGATKRFGERVALAHEGRAHQPVYVLRLGQVYGELQSPSLTILDQLRNETAYVPAESSDTVFAFSIAEALREIALGHVMPGIYTLVSCPPWTWKEVHEYYCARLGITPRVIEVPSSAFVVSGGQVKAALERLSGRFASTFRGPLEGYLLSRLPNLEAAIAARYRRRTAAKEIQELYREYRPYDPCLGRIPGKQLSCLTDSRVSMEPLAREVRKILALAPGTGISADLDCTAAIGASGG